MKTDEDIDATEPDEDEDDEDDDEDDDDAMTSGRPYVPPATDRDGPKPTFGEQCDQAFTVPRRLMDKPY